MDIFSILNFYIKRRYQCNVVVKYRVNLWKVLYCLIYPNVTHIFRKIDQSIIMKSRFANANIYARYSLSVFGWPCGTGTRKIRELILVLFSSLTPSSCPLSPHTTLLIDGGWYHNVCCGLCITLLFLFVIQKKKKRKENVKLYYIKQFFPWCIINDPINLIFQVIAAFVAKHYKNQLDPQQKAARAAFPQLNYLY